MGQTAEELKDEGNVLFKNKEWLKSAAVYTKGIKADPEHAVLYRCLLYRVSPGRRASTSWLIRDPWLPPPSTTPASTKCAQIRLRRSRSDHKHSKLQVSAVGWVESSLVAPPQHHGKGSEQPRPGQPRMCALASSVP